MSFIIPIEDGPFITAMLTSADGLDFVPVQEDNTPTHNMITLIIISSCFMALLLSVFFELGYCEIPGRAVRAPTYCARCWHNAQHIVGAAIGRPPFATFSNRLSFKCAGCCVFNYIVL